MPHPPRFAFFGSLLASTACAFLTLAGTALAQTPTSFLEEQVEVELPESAATASGSDPLATRLGDAASIQECARRIELTGEARRLTSAQAAWLKGAWCEVAQGYPEYQQQININQQANAAVVNGSYLQIGTTLLRAYAQFAKANKKGQAAAPADDLLRFTLAHELGHAVKSHNGKKRLREIAWQLSAGATAVGTFTTGSKLKKGLILAGGSYATYLAYCNSFNGVVRAEFQADLFALERLQALGFDALAAGQGLIAFMDAHAIDQESPKCISREALKNMTSSEWKIRMEARNPHPSTAERLAQMNQWAVAR